MHYLITGHTGFKGAWLTLWLTEAGHRVSGLALDPIPGALYERASMGHRLANDVRADVRDSAAVRQAIHSARPDVVIHMAAQPLVLESYRNPRFTVDTNVTGTMNVLEAVAAVESVQAQVVVTTDKVYRNIGQTTGYVESDPLGGDDPYSASKAMADLLTQSWTASFASPPTAIARAGNVIGGGDTCANRLLPDLIHAFREGRPAAVRFPQAIRPWQHVLDCLHGYLLLVDHLMAGNGSGAWNFGPPPNEHRAVREVASLAAELWESGATWSTDHSHSPHEAARLTIDPSKAHELLGWKQQLDFEAAIEWVVRWEKSATTPAASLSATLAQLRAFQALVSLSTRPN
jgi:CDP-glucose 4,6-dehydratase